MDIQVNKSHYALEHYVDTERWNSYYNQVREITKSNFGGAVLIIGKGDGIVGAIIDKVYNIETVSFDFDASLEPDVVGDVCKISDLLDREFETVVCCQVLEHIPFKFFETTIRGISNICSNTFILSLPVRSFRFSVTFKIPKCKRHVINIVIPRFYEKNAPWNGQHYWEVGTKKKGVRDINSILSKYFFIENDYLLKENPFHYFWILKKRK